MTLSAAVQPRRAAPRLRIAGALAGLAALCATPALAAAQSDGYYGVVPAAGAVPPDNDFAQMAAGGADGARVSIQWPYVETEPGVYDWSATDDFVRRAIAHDVEPLAFIYGTARWAAEMDGEDCPEITSCTTLGPSSDATRRAFAAFARKAVERYGPNGEFFRDPPPCPITVPEPVPDPADICPAEPPCQCETASPVRRWQVWNEQNSPKYFAPTADARSYASLLKRTSKAIRAADAGAEVILGGMWGPNSYLGEPATRPVVPVSLYLKRLYRVRGVANAFDTVGVHPYSENVSGALAQLRVARKSLDRAGDRKAGIWITEIGWASGGPRDDPYVKGINGQALLAARLLRKFDAKRRAFRLRGVFWYSWRDDPFGDQICSWCANAGLRTRSGAPKPSWESFVRVATR